MIRLSILGSPELYGQDGQVVLSVLSQPQRLTLLSYLTLTSVGAFTPRQKLVSLFWPDSGPERGRASLRTTLHGLRKSLGNRVLVVRGDEVGIADGVLWCDALEFERAVEDDDPDRAWTLYRGPLLEHISKPGAPELNRWLEDQRTRIHRKAGETTTLLSQRSEQEGDLHEALRWARATQSLDPLSETGIRRQIRLLGQGGERDVAVRVYEEFATRLAAELDLEPTAETTALLESIRTASTNGSTVPDHALDPTPSAVEVDPAAPVETPPPLPLVEVSPHGAYPLPRRRYLATATIALAAAVIGVSLWGTTADPPLVGDGERVILADFTDATGEGIGRAVTAALRIDLLESTVLDLVEGPDVESTLALMRGEGGLELTPERAREVAIRDGIAAVIDGEVTRAGTGYLITATLRAAETGRSLAALRVTAEGPDEVVASIDELSQALRQRAGEPLRTIRTGKPLAQVTTNSLEALRLYTEATGVMYQRREGRPPGQLLEEALALDPEFAMAWRLLGVSRFGDPAGRAEGHRNAFLFRDRLPERERYLVEGTYYDGVTYDVDRAVEAYRNVIRIDPEDPAALNNLANILRGARNDLAGAEELQRRAIASPRRAVLHYSTLVDNLLHQGRVEDAAEVFRDWQEAFPEGAPSKSFPILFVGGALNEATRYALAQASDAERSPPERSWGAMDAARVEYWKGRLDEARRLAQWAEALLLLPGRPVVRWNSRLDAAYGAALVGDREWAHEYLSGALDGAYPELPFTQAHHTTAARRLVSMGEFEAAERVIRDWEAGKADELKGPSEVARMALASVQLTIAQGDTVGAVDRMLRLLIETGCSESCLPFFQATVYDRLGHHAQAAEQYERVLRPGYHGWGMDVSERIHAMMRLGPLYEAIGDTARAIGAYQRMADQWADGDERGLEVVRQSRERMAALGG